MELSVEVTITQEVLEEVARFERLIEIVTSPQFKHDLAIGVAALILTESLGYATKEDLLSASRLLDFANEVW